MADPGFRDRDRLPIALVSGAVVFALGNVALLIYVVLERWPILLIPSSLGVLAGVGLWLAHPWVAKRHDRERASKGGDYG